MPGLIGYMLAIVVTLGSYLAGLNWLISPPDPWQPNSKIRASTAQQFTPRKRPPVVKPLEAAPIPESTALSEPDTTPASVENSASVEISENETPRPIEPAIMQAPRSAEAPPQPAATRPAAEPVHVVRREVPETRTVSGSRKRFERSNGRKLELMVLRTYERSDGKRFTRLLPLSSARSAMAFQPDDRW
jgi:hypothetical protein